MADDDPTIEARIGAYEVIASRHVIVDGGEAFTLHPFPSSLDFILTVDLRPAPDRKSPAAWVESDPDGFPRLIIERVQSSLSELGISAFIGFAINEKYQFYINFSATFAGTLENHTVNFAYMLARKAK